MSVRQATIITVIALAAEAFIARGSGIAAAQTQARTAAPSPATQGLAIDGTWVQSPGEVQSTYSLETGFPEAHAKIANARPVKRSVVIDPRDGRIPFQPWALKVRDAREAVHDDDSRLTSRNLDGRAKCYPAGVPRFVTGSGLITMTRFPDRVTMQTEFAHQYRVIYTDGRQHLHKSLKLWNGDSRGRWDGSTLVVETTNLNGYAWLDVIGSFTTDEATVVERLTPIDANTIGWTATITDPNVFTRPWTVRWHLVRDPEKREIWEHACVEGNKFGLWATIRDRERGGTAR
jgi:hypothetical protein